MDLSMEAVAILFLLSAVVWTNQTFAPKKPKKDKSPEEELAEAIGKYMSKGKAREFQFSLKIQREEDKS
jgi:hypothetical protein